MPSHAATEIERQLIEANRQLAAGNAESAMVLAQGALARTPLTPGLEAEAWHVLGVGQLLCGALDDADRSLARAIALNATQPGYHVNRGTVLKRLQRYDDALGSYRQALALKSDSDDAHNGMGQVFLARGDLDAAEAAFRQAIAGSPEAPAAYRHLADLELMRGSTDRAIQALQTVVGMAPRDRASWKKLGNVLRSLNRNADAQAAFERAGALDATDLGAGLLQCMAALPVVYEHPPEIGEARRRYAESLAALQERVLRAPPDRLAAAADDVGVAKPFYLSYQGRNDRDLQATYGQIVEAMMGARFPGLRSAPLPEARGQRRLRVGFAAAPLHLHSVVKLNRGAIQELDRARFDVHIYHLDSHRDAQTDALEACATRFVQGPMQVADWGRIIRDDRLDVLYHLEIGMHPMTVALAALRLAPVQCTTWSHPVTSGLSAIDYFLSSALMEPANGAEHYTERLILLPNLGIHYAPIDVGIAPLQRDQLGFGPGVCIFLCCQSLFKYLPHYDDLIARIASLAPTARFVFILHPSDHVNTVMKRRLERSFGRYGLAWTERCRLVAPLPPAHFQGLLRLCDVCLDSVGWSGGNTTLEALEAGLPVITLPTDLMRGRHTAAILTMLGLPELIALNPDGYIALAVALARDLERRRALSERIQRDKARLYRDLAPVRALEAFFDWAVTVGDPATAMPAPDAPFTALPHL